MPWRRSSPPRDPALRQGRERSELLRRFRSGRPMPSSHRQLLGGWTVKERPRVRGHHPAPFRCPPSLSRSPGRGLRERPRPLRILRRPQASSSSSRVRPPDPSTTDRGPWWSWTGDRHEALRRAFLRSLPPTPLVRAPTPEVLRRLGEFFRAERLPRTILPWETDWRRPIVVSSIASSSSAPVDRPGWESRRRSCASGAGPPGAPRAERRGGRRGAVVW